MCISIESTFLLETDEKEIEYNLYGVETANSHWQAAGPPFQQPMQMTISRYVATLHINRRYSNIKILMF
jgi:hypothetical protein